MTAPPAGKPAAALTPKELIACWADLAGNSEQAYVGIWKLADDKGTIEFLRENLSPVPPAPDAKMLASLLADLRSDQFAVRSKADQALKKIAVAAEKELHQAVKDAATLEGRRRVEVVLQTVEDARVRNHRAIEVLELMNTAAARDLLDRLAKGAAGAWQTREAQATLDRLARRPIRR